MAELVKAVAGLFQYIKKQDPFVSAIKMGALALPLEVTW